jgi:hypothetical protein
LRRATDFNPVGDEVLLAPTLVAEGLLP